MMEYPQDLEKLCNSFGIAFDGLELRGIDEARISIAIKEYSQMVKEEIEFLKKRLKPAKSTTSTSSGEGHEGRTQKYRSVVDAAGS